jgi:hypothetical protein
LPFALQKLPWLEAAIFSCDAKIGSEIAKRGKAELFRDD